MTIGAFASGGARIVRWVTIAVAIGLLVGLLAIHAFTSRYGQQTSPVDIRPSSSGIPVSVVTGGATP